MNKEKKLVGISTMVLVIGSAIAVLIGILPSTIYIIINKNLKCERSHNK